MALVLKRTLKSVLYGVASADPFVILAVIFVLSATGVGAIWAPARRAAMTDPAITLRNE